MAEDSTVALEALRVDEGKLKGHVDEVVRSSVEETLNGLLEAEADSICGRSAMSVRRSESIAAPGTMSASWRRKAGEVTLKGAEAAHACPLRRRSSSAIGVANRSVEEALVEMYLAGVSVRRVEDITEALWGTRVSSGTVSRLNQKIYGTSRPGATGRSRASSRTCTWMA